MFKFVLASGSPRRKELLSTIQIPFEVIVSNEDEKITKKIPSEVVEELSLSKAKSVYKKVEAKHEKLIVIGADTVVALDEMILGKPASKDDAYNMIKELAGRSHFVYTGVAILIKNGSNYIEKSFNVNTKVFVNSMTHEQIMSYINTDEPYDKAGGYGIQGIFSRHIDHIEGDYFNVVGLPVSKIYDNVYEYIV